MYFGADNSNMNDRILNKAQRNEVRTAMKDGFRRSSGTLRFAHLAVMAFVLMIGVAGQAISADNNLLHNSNRFACSDGAYQNQVDCEAALETWDPDRRHTGGWGTATGVYGEFTCNTCHTKSTGNIKRIRTSITTPDTAIATLPGDGQTIVFLDATDTTSDFGDDSVTHVTSDKVCAVCHTYDAAQTVGVKQHAYNMGVIATHYNNNDCTACHKHNQGFKASGDCDGCHGYPPDAADGFGYQAVEGKGAHLAHVQHLELRSALSRTATVDSYGDATVTALCGVCHDMNGAAHETGGGTRNINFNGSATYQFGASPLYNGVQGTPSLTTAKSCSNVSCHFKETPVWE
jgi:hypothetical protein